MAKKKGALNCYHFNVYISSVLFQELFDDLKLEGIGLNEYEITTTFPHKIVSALPHNTSFKHAGLYPRQTVYIQWTE